MSKIDAELVIDSLVFLPKKEARAIYLYYVKGLNVEKSAVEMKMTGAGIHYLRHRALKKLKGYLLTKRERIEIITDKIK